MPRKSSLILVFLGVLILVSFVVASRAISNSNGCNQFVIDSYEWHSGIDIPPVEFVSCYCDQNSGVRVAVYNLKKNMNLSQFESVKSGEVESLFKGSFLLSKNELPTKNELLIAKGQNGNNRWVYLLDAKSKRLWAKLDF